MQTLFSAGALYGIRNDTSGIGPDQFGLLQSAAVDWTFDTKELYGERQYPAVIARGQGKITGKASSARVFGALYGDIFFGKTPTTANLRVSQDEAGTVAGSPTYAVTVANSTLWTDNLGVYLVSTGARLKQVSTSPASGEYSVSAGVYTFNSAQGGAAVLISYLYTAVTGKRIAISNDLMGVTPTFKMVLHNPGRTQTGTSPFSLVLNLCAASKLSIPTRINDFTIPEFDFMAYADASDVVGYLSTTD